MRARKRHLDFLDVFPRPVVFLQAKVSPGAIAVGILKLGFLCDGLIVLHDGLRIVLLGKVGLTTLEMSPRVIEEHDTGRQQAYEAQAHAGDRQFVTVEYTALAVILHQEPTAGDECPEAEEDYQRAGPCTCTDWRPDDRKAQDAKEEARDSPRVQLASTLAKQFSVHEARPTKHQEEIGDRLEICHGLQMVDEDHQKANEHQSDAHAAQHDASI